MPIRDCSDCENSTANSGLRRQGGSRSRPPDVVQRRPAFFWRWYVWIHCAIVLLAGLGAIAGDLFRSILPSMLVEPLVIVVYFPVSLVGPAFLVSFLMFSTAVRRRDPKLLAAAVADLFVSMGQLLICLPAVQ